MDWNFLIRNKESISVSTDTRNLPAGCVFFALHGANFDGNQFAQQALDKGASLVIIDDPKAFLGPQTILVPDTLKALQSLARAWRRQWAKFPTDNSSVKRQIIGITGTNGKTTTKELLAAVLRTHYNIHFTQGNLNNSIGVPLTLLQLTRAHQLAIIEMGASHPGDIRELVNIAEPDLGLITNVGRAHLQGFGSFEGVMHTKAELYDFLLAHHATIFLNEDNPLLVEMLSSSCHPPVRVLTKSLQSPNKVLTKSLQSPNKVLTCSRPCRDLTETLPRPYRDSLVPHTIPYHNIPMPSGTHLVGSYNAENIAAALCVGQHFGISSDEALAAVRAYEPTNNRSQSLQTAHNDLVVDAYNANPTSMQAAIQAFLASQSAASSSRPAMFILGEMRELGDYSRLEHQNIVNMLLEHKENQVLLVGEEYHKTTAPYPIFHDVQALREHLLAHSIVDHRILVKGSRGNQLEKILDVL